MHRAGRINFGKSPLMDLFLTCRLARDVHSLHGGDHISELVVASPEEWLDHRRLLCGCPDGYTHMYGADGGSSRYARDTRPVS